MDVRSTVEALAAAGVRVRRLALGGIDLTSVAGKITMRVLNAVAEFGRGLLIGLYPRDSTGGCGCGLPFGCFLPKIVPVLSRGVFFLFAFLGGRISS
jgi:hypothetical protein